MGYERNVHRRLQEVFEAAGAEERELRLESARYVVLSDQHKGQRDGADDFRRCERIYHAALGFYLESGYTLLALGDVEELWECRPRNVIAVYRYTLELEGEFYRRGRYERFSGNHDDEWESARSVKKYLDPFFPGISVREGARFRVTSDGVALGTLFVVHGHQGTTFDDRHRTIAKLFVRHIWRPIQRILRFPSTTPAEDFELRDKHDRTLYAWAVSQERVVLIAGHTHRPVFMSASHHAQLESALERARAELEREPGDTARAARVAALRSELEWVKAQGGARPGPSERSAAGVKPCYFNSGCCSFGDGDITGLEIADGQIRLVRWPNDAGEPRGQVLASADLKPDVFAALRRP